ncbi:MAG: pilus assembly protein [Deltaproteobacteria bacterium]|nr:pilus assembly protein [Deltaproteobacteria bacterium]
MMERGRGFRRRGSNAIEFGLIFPVLLVFIGAMLDFSWYFFQEQSVISVVRGTVREVAVMDYDHSAGEWGALVESATRSALVDAGFGTRGTVRAVDGASAWPDQLVGVQVELPYEPLFGLTPAPRNIQWQFLMRVEDQGPDPSS